MPWMQAQGQRSMELECRLNACPLQAALALGCGTDAQELISTCVVTGRGTRGASEPYAHLADGAS